jgi:hypothetical protein
MRRFEIVWGDQSGPARRWHVREVLERSQRIDGDRYRGRENPDTALPPAGAPIMTGRARGVAKSPPMRNTPVRR